MSQEEFSKQCERDRKKENNDGNDAKNKVVNTGFGQGRMLHLYPVIRKLQTVAAAN
jgi:hypothetical protein